MASGRSAGSVGGDTNSLASEEMSAFLADVTTKPFNKDDFINSIVKLENDDSDDEDDNKLLDINKGNDSKRNKSESKLSKTIVNEKSKSIKLHNETSDSGLNLSD